MHDGNRRDFLRWTAGGAAAVALGGLWNPSWAQAPLGERPRQDAGVELLGPRGRVPASFIIDDSTCLVNMGHFCMPQFAEAWPNRDEYKKPWATWPREIPDAFVREFGEWCAEHGIRGKYSIVPFPACVGWLDRELPGWSRQQLRDSLKLVRELMAPRWDIHPEMITHTRAIELATGRPIGEINAGTMENSYPQVKKTTDEMAAYMAYALRILKNCDLPCEGITTPGGFGNLVKSELSLGVYQAVRDVYGSEIPHYFKYIRDGKEDTWPIPEHVTGLDTDQPRFVMNVVAGTGDWFCGWDGDRPSEGARYASEDATRGRMVELIERGEPAVMFGHWAGLFANGAKAGFHDLQKVIGGLELRYRDRLFWMKTSELARYGAARALTTVVRKTSDGEGQKPQAATTTVELRAPVACPRFTMRLAAPPGKAWSLRDTNGDGKPAMPIVEVRTLRELDAGHCWRDEDSLTLCFDLPKGTSRLSCAE